MTIDELLPKLARSKRFRAEFVKSHTKQLLPLQIRDLMEQHELNQTDLAEASKLSQGTISRAIDPEYGNLTINTCVSIAAGCDVAFIGHFVPYSELFRWLNKHGSDARIYAFDEEFDEAGNFKALDDAPTQSAVLDNIEFRTASADVIDMSATKTNSPVAPAATSNPEKFKMGVAS